MIEAALVPCWRKKALLGNDSRSSVQYGALPLLPKNMQTEINIKVGKRSPFDYFSILKEQCSGGELRFGGINDFDLDSARGHRRE